MRIKGRGTLRVRIECYDGKIDKISIPGLPMGVSFHLNIGIKKKALLSPQQQENNVLLNVNSIIYIAKLLPIAYHPTHSQDGEWSGRNAV